MLAIGQDPDSNYSCTSGNKTDDSLSGANVWVPAKGNAAAQQALVSFAATTGVPNASFIRGAEAIASDE